MGDRRYPTRSGGLIRWASTPSSSPFSARWRPVGSRAAPAPAWPEAQALGLGGSNDPDRRRVLGIDTDRALPLLPTELRGVVPGLRGDPSDHLLPPPPRARRGVEHRAQQRGGGGKKRARGEVESLPPLRCTPHGAARVSCCARTTHRVTPARASGVPGPSEDDRRGFSHPGWVVVEFPLSDFG